MKDTKALAAELSWNKALVAELKWNSKAHPLNQWSTLGPNKRDELIAAEYRLKSFDSHIVCRSLPKGFRII
ncbi:MAG: hypothetical protein Q8O94_02365 [bacterium]|nr:hypothetical protein [bacterium]